MIAFYTLFIFGHRYNGINDDLLVVGKNTLHRISLEKCLALLWKNKLAHRVFHVNDDHKRIFAVEYEDCVTYDGELITKNVLDRKKIPSIETGEKHQCYPSMYDTYSVGIYNGNHQFSWSEGAFPKEEYEKIYILKKETKEPGYSLEPNIDYNGCELCEKFSYDNFKMDDPEEFVQERKEIILNNLVFNFRDYQFKIIIHDNHAEVTFDRKAVGGFQHASFHWGTQIEVEHAVPSTLEYKKTTHLDTIKLEFSRIDDEVIIVSRYQAIEVL